MTYVICDPCIGVKHGACMDVCPIECIDDAGGQRVIDPDRCIACGACAEACPVAAIYRLEEVPSKWRTAIARNAAFFARSTQDSSTT